MSEKLEVNRRAIGQKVIVYWGHDIWKGIIVDVKDEETFWVRGYDGEQLVEVSIWDVRNCD